jgi:hypothetical protein
MIFGGFSVFINRICHFSLKILLEDIQFQIILLTSLNGFEKTHRSLFHAS